MSQNFASITETPGIMLSPEQYQRFLHRYALGMRESNLLEGKTRILEVGCGAGSGLAAWDEAVQANGGLAVGLDYVESSLQLARANLGEGLPLLSGDAQALPFTDASFDAIASFEVIYYLPDLSAFLNESRRVLAPGGKLILCWSNPQWRDFAPGRHSGHYPTAAEVANLLARVGFGKARCYGAFPSAQTNAKTMWVNRMRRVAVRLGLTALLGALTAPLMRAAYGELTPLPERLSLEEIVDVDATVTEVDSSAGNAGYRVLYAVAHQDLP